MHFALTGIFDDGRAVGFDVQMNTRREINYVRGDSFTVDVTMLYPDGSRVDVGSGVGVSAQLVVKRNSRDWMKWLNLTGVVLTPALSGEPSPIGVMRFTANPSAFTQILPGRYVYDVFLTIGGVRNAVIPLSHFFVQPSTIGPQSIPNP